MSLSEKYWDRCSRCVVTFPERRLYLTYCHQIYYLPRFRLDVRDEEVICPECTSRTRISEIFSKLGQDELVIFRDSEKILDRVITTFLKITKMINAVRSFRKRQYEATIKGLTTKIEGLTNLINKLEKQNNDSKKSIARLRALQIGTGPTINRPNATVRRDGDKIDDLTTRIRELTRLLSEHKERGKVLSGRVRDPQINSLNVGSYLRVIHPKISPNSLGIRGGNNTSVISREKSKFGVSVVCQNRAVGTMEQEMKPPNCTPVKKSCLRSGDFSEMGGIFLMDDSDVDSSHIFPSIGCGRNGSCR